MFDNNRQRGNSQRSYQSSNDAFPFRRFSLSNGVVNYVVYSRKTQLNTMRQTHPRVCRLLT